MSADCFVGIDGGGSKTKAVLCTASGRVLARTHTGPCALIGPPTPEIREHLRHLTATLCRDAQVTPQAVARWCLGLNGIDFVDEIPTQFAALTETLGVPSERVLLVNDGIIALAGTGSAPVAAILQHGSGFTSAYRRQFGQETLFDHLNVGRIFDLRFELQALLARMIDGRAEITPLKERVLRHFHIDDERTYAELAFRRRIPISLILHTPDLVFEGWLAGDAAATWLVTQAIESYAVTTEAMLRRAGKGAELFLGGGVINRAPEPFWQLLTARLHKTDAHLLIGKPQFPPEFGAVALCAFHSGIDPAVFFGRLMAEQEREKHEDAHVA